MNVRILSRGAVTVLAVMCLTLLIAHSQPGLLDLTVFNSWLVFLGILALLPIAAIGGVGLVAYVVFDVSKWGWRRILRLPWAELAVAGGILVVMALALRFVLPARAGFAISMSAFEAYVSGAPVSQYGGAALNQPLGMYAVDEYAEDPRGGVYFRVRSGSASLGPDVISYGFACRPNGDGTPFGAGGYKLQHLMGDWYVFEASDDWY